MQHRPCDPILVLDMILFQSNLLTKLYPSNNSNLSFVAKYFCHYYLVTNKHNQLLSLTYCTLSEQSGNLDIRFQKIVNAKNLIRGCRVRNEITMNYAMRFYLETIT